MNNENYNLLNEGFFDWMKGLLKNLVGKIFHVSNYEKFIDRLNKFPKVILGIDNSKSEENTSESYNVPKRSRKKLFEARSRFATKIVEDDTDATKAKDEDGIKKMSKDDFLNEFQPISYDDLGKSTKMPSFKNVLIKRLEALNKSRVQMIEKFTPTVRAKLQKALNNGKTIAMSDIQVLEIFVSDFLNLYSSGTMGLPKVEKDKKMTISELSQYNDVVNKANPSKKFAVLYEDLNKIIKFYEESFNSEWEFVRQKEEEYEKQKADNASWSGDGEVNYKAIKKISDNEIEVKGAIDSLIEGCRELIPNAIAGFFINSPIYKDTEQEINEILKLLIQNEKVAEEGKKNPNLKVITLFSDIANDTVKDEDKEKVEEASILFSNKINNIVNNQKLKDMNFSNNISFEDIIKKTNVKITQKETVESLIKKIPDYSCKLAFACLYYVMLNKEIPIEVKIDNQSINLFNVDTQQLESLGKRYNLKKIYDYYIWQK